MAQNPLDPVRTPGRRDRRPKASRPLRLPAFECEGRSIRPIVDRLLALDTGHAGARVALRDETLGIDLRAASWSAMRDLLADHLVVLWRNYATVDDAQLTPRAQELKRRLLAAFSDAGASRPGGSE